jgi:hypothetical protein
VPEKTRVQFRALLTEKLNSLTYHAKDKNITLPEGFAFGFDEYLGILKALESLSRIPNTDSVGESQNARIHSH